MPPSVSVIIPNYNHEKFLAQRIDSVLNQTYPDFEVIILDDVSTDDSKLIIEEYRGHPKISHIVFNEENSGSTFKQWNKGVKLATGEYVWIAESDDYADVDFLRKTVPQFDDASVCLTFAQSYRIDEHGTIIDDCINWYSDEFKSSFKVNGETFVKNFLVEKNSIYNASAVLFRKSAYPLHDKMVERFKFMGDWLVWIKICEIGKVVYLTDRLNYFRYQQSSVTIKYHKTIINLIEDYRLLNYLKVRNFITDKKAYQNKLNFFAGQWLQSKKSDLNTKLRLIKYALAVDKLVLLRLAALWAVKNKGN